MVPVALRTRLFTLAEAGEAGITRSQLRGASYRRLGSGFYRWVDLQESPQLMLSAFARRLPAGAAFSGRTAAWLHGLDVAPCEPVEVTIPQSIGSRWRAGATVRRAALGREEIVRRRSVPTTSALRTVLDLAGRGPLIEGVVAADMFLHARLVTFAKLRRYAAEHPGAKGIARLRRVVDLAEPKAESPMETRLRMLLMLAGLPRPEVQVSIRDDQGRFWVAQTSFIAFSAWPSNTTAATTAIGWLMTTAAKTASSARAFACCASPRRTYLVLPTQSPSRCVRPLPPRPRGLFATLLPADEHS